jgi:hypothetical protein
MFNYKKIASVLASAVMLSSTIGFAAALSYPAPFVTSGSADSAVVVGLNADISDLNAALDVGQSLNTLVSVGSGAAGGSSVSGGDSVLLAKSSDNLNLGNTWGVFTGSIDEEDLKTLLADGTYRADDNDEFDFEQKITIGSPTLTHFRDSDYEDLAGLDEKTPVLGFKITSNTFIMNYTLDFVQDIESTVDSNGDLDDIEGSDITILGKQYYVSDFKNSTLKMTLLDSAVISSVGDVGDSVTVNVKDKSYSVTTVYVDADEVVYDINGERSPSTGKLNVGDSYKLNDGSYVGVRDISKLEIAGETGSSSFSIGSGKIELTHGADIKLNDDTLTGVRAYIAKGSYSSPDEKISSIAIEWKTDDEEFLAPGQDLVMPGFEAVKFTMGPILRNQEEKITIEKDGDDSLQLSIPIKDGTVNFNLLYATSGNFVGLGEDATHRLKTSSGSTLTFQERDQAGSELDKWFVASYNTTSEGESYLLRAKVREDVSNGRNETDIEKNVDGEWVTVCEEKKATDTCDIGDVSLTIDAIYYVSGGGENVTFTGSTGVSFNTMYTAGGLRFTLPFGDVNTSSTEGAINFSVAENGTVGHSFNRFYLVATPENRDDDLASATALTFVLDGTSDNKMHVPNVNTTGNGPGAGTGGSGGKELGNTNNYEAYAVGDVATRIIHYTGGDEDYVEIYYPSGNSETYAEIFLAETGATITPGSTGTTVGSGGQVLIVKDSEMSSVAGKNLIVVGGSCINTAAARILDSDSPLCTSAFTDATGVGPGQYIIKTVQSPWAADKVAMLVAGYDAADTADAVRKAMEGVVTDSGSETIYPISGTN